MESRNVSHENLDIQLGVLGLRLHNDPSCHEEVDVEHGVAGVVIGSRSSEGLPEVSRLLFDA